ncbi:MAG TPA: response regulator [Methylomirabilota bacterium]|nr:response regulator [Methylomirabilota bacterium]
MARGSIENGHWSEPAVQVAHLPSEDITRRLVIVEDESLLAEDLAMRLTRLGYEVVGIAPSGEAGVEVGERMRPDLVLMDIHLRGQVDGITAAERLRDRFDIPVVFLTGNADDRTFERAKAVCPLGFVIKPFDGRQLQIAVEVALARHAAERALLQAGQLRAVVLLAGGAAHEINNPLTVVKGMLQLVSKTLPEGTQERKRLDMALDAAERIKDAVARLAHVTRLELAESQPRVPPMLDLRRSSGA